jgi:uncharacterized protein
MAKTFSKQEILMLIKAHKEILEKRFGLLSIGLFGSYARGENNQNSDIDFFVELKKQSFSDYAGLEIYLENLFQQKVQVVINYERLSPRFMNNIKKDLIYA